MRLHRRFRRPPRENMFHRAVTHKTTESTHTIMTHRDKQRISSIEYPTMKNIVKHSYDEDDNEMTHSHSQSCHCEFATLELKKK